MQRRLFPDPKPLVDEFGADFFRQLPEAPGVYLMHDVSGVVLYVGKAKSLRRRLDNYRVANPEQMPRRTLRLLRLVKRITWELCDSESAALTRESALLLSLKPRFNRAGVWRGPDRFLAWRFHKQTLELAVRTGPPGADWFSAGPFGAQARVLYRSLVRLFWCVLQPDRGLFGMPPGWFDGPLPEMVVIKSSGHNSLEEHRWVHSWYRIASGPAEENAQCFAARIATLSSCERLVLEADLEYVATRMYDRRRGSAPDSEKRAPAGFPDTKLFAF